MSYFPPSSMATQATEAAYTPTISWTTNVVVTGTYTIVETTRGPLLSFRIRLHFTGAPSSGNLTISYLPSGYTLDTSRLPAAGNTYYGHPIGTGFVDDAGVASRGLLHIQLLNTTIAMVQYQNATATLVAVTPTAPYSIGSADYIYLEATNIPVSQS